MCTGSSSNLDIALSVGDPDPSLSLMNTPTPPVLNNPTGVNNPPPSLMNNGSLDMTKRESAADVQKLQQQLHDIKEQASVFLFILAITSLKECGEIFLFFYY